MVKITQHSVYYNMAFGSIVMCFSDFCNILYIIHLYCNVPCIKHNSILRYVEYFKFQVFNPKGMKEWQDT